MTLPRKTRRRIDITEKDTTKTGHYREGHYRERGLYMRFDTQCTHIEFRNR